MSDAQYFALGEYRRKFRLAAAAETVTKIMAMTRIALFPSTGVVTPVSPTGDEGSPVAPLTVAEWRVDFGKRVSEARAKAGLTPELLGIKCFILAEDIVKIEAGDWGNFSHDVNIHHLLLLHGALEDYGITLLNSSETTKFLAGTSL